MVGMVPYLCLEKRDGEKGKMTLALKEKVTCTPVSDLSSYRSPSVSAVSLPPPNYSCIHCIITTAWFCCATKSKKHIQTTVIVGVGEYKPKNVSCLAKIRFKKTGLIIVCIPEIQKNYVQWGSEYRTSPKK